MTGWWSDRRLRTLAALSHDLRTPLTRLRLRAERIEGELRYGVLREIDRIDHMLDETLRYLRDDLHAEPLSMVDLASLLRTLCCEFADVGHDVAYSGPERLAWTCRSEALCRAVSNLVENALRHGDTVVVGLHATGTQTVRIEVRDDGPGIDASSRQAVLQPFVSAGSASDAGPQRQFGLGLAIAQDVVRGHGGELHLLEGHPRGLVARIELPGGE